MKFNEFTTEAPATKTRLDPKCWTGKKIGNPKTKVKGGVRVNNCVPAESIEEGAMKHAMHKDAERMSREQFCPKYGDEHGEFWDNIMGQLDEEWSKKYKDSINCASPKGFSQRAHCASKNESIDDEYNNEAGMAQGNLYTIAQAAQGLVDTIDDQDNLPEWVQEKIAKVEGMLVNVWNYLQSQKAQGIDPQVSEDWQKANKKDKTDGMSKKAVSAYRRENPGSKLKTAVTTKPSELKAGSKDAKRRKSFCARMSGNKGPMKDEKGRPTPKAKALSRWNCE